MRVDRHSQQRCLAHGGSALILSGPHCFLTWKIRLCVEPEREAGFDFLSSGSSDSRRALLPDRTASEAGLRTSWFWVDGPSSSDHPRTCSHESSFGENPDLAPLEPLTRPP